MTLLRLKGIHKIFPNGIRAIDNVDLGFKSGGFNVVLGPSGAGKSTLLRIINGLETPTTGKVIFNNEELNCRSQRRLRSQIGMVFQQFNLVDRINVMSNVLCGRLAHCHWFPSMFHLFPKSDYDACHEALARVGLVEKAWQRADQLSGGQQQRVGVARALAQQPKLILADEPVASLDPATSEEVMQLLRQICEEDGITIIANLHQVEIAKRYSDRVVGLNRGRVVFDGHPNGLNRSVLARIYDAKDMESHGQDLLAVANA